MPVWSHGQTLIARYGIGVTVGSEELGRQTVYGVQNVEVSIWAKECRAERLSYIYQGTEKDRDIQRLLDGNMQIGFEMYDGGVINRVPSLDLVLDGVAEIPSHLMKMEFMRGSDRLTHEWPSDAWSRGRARMYQPDPRLPWFPEQIQVEISFPDTGYVWSRVLDTQEAAKRLEIPPRDAWMPKPRERVQPTQRERD